MCKKSKDQTEIELKGGIIPEYYVSTKPLLLYYGEVTDSLKADLRSAFTDFIPLNVEEVKVDFKGRPALKSPIVPQTVRTESPKGKGIYDFNTTVKLYGIIWSDVTGSWQAYHGYKGDVYAPEKFSNLGKVKRWDNTKYDNFAFKWKKVKPEYKSYSNEATPWDKLDYTEAEIPNETKWEYLCHSPQKPVTGVAYYALDVGYKSTTYSTPNSKTRLHPHNPQRPTALYDTCISDEVMRIIVKGNYTQGNKDYLNWAAAHINAPWIYGSYWEHQAKRFIGYDCADMAMNAYELWGGKVPLPADPEDLKDFPIDGSCCNRIWEYSRDYPEKFEERLGPTQTFEIPENKLLPGDLILLGEENPNYYKGFKPKHTVIFVKHDNSGKLSEEDELLQANYEHPGGELYRVGPGTFKFKRPAGVPYAVVIRLHK